MIRFLSGKEIDIKKWDNAISGSWHETAYGYCWYLDIVTPGWCGLVLDDYKAVMPLVTSKKAGLSYVLNVPFMQYTTIYGLKPDNVLFREFMKAIPAKFRYLDFKIYLPFEPVLKNAEIYSHTNVILDLSQSKAGLFSCFNTNTKRNIKKAEKQNVRVETSDNPEPIIDTYTRFKQRKYNSRFDDNIAVNIRNVIQSGIRTGSGELLYAYDSGNNCLGGTYFQKSASRIIYLFSAAEDEAKSTGAMAYIVKKQIDNYAGTKMILDFEGSDIPGIARFYKGFGSTDEKYFHIKINRLPKLIKWIKR
ncbi:hypothetical protein ACE01N_08155 [Saccharicrinis sp. FJH2]|uniref:hypothetical protein n=1 Tax=Saccharicrinis sp. FJH65 TaxID=3344659 RepID=UPI0035F249FA